MIGYSVKRYKNRLLQSFFQKKNIKASLLKNLTILDEIDFNTPINHVDFAVVDTELTGLDEKKDSIISIGVVKMTGTKIILGDYFHRILDPAVCPKRDSVLIHGITPQEISSCPPLELILPEFVDFIKNRIIVGHCISIDLAFINKEMHRLYGFSLQNPSIDTIHLYWWLKKKKSGYDAYVQESVQIESNLFDIAKEYEIPIIEGHSAIGDAFMTAQLFQRFLPQIRQRGIEKLSDLIKIGKS
ncbi:MAG: 3'-5' exonuclease [Thermodesulfovibrionales bacterium]|nr:3'-5' exonuclease [Thermodesulfovibrionales bacterium]